MRAFDRSVLRSRFIFLPYCAMNFETYVRSKFADYAAFAEPIGAILKAALGNHPDELRLQQLEHRAKEPDSLLKNLRARCAEATQNTRRRDQRPGRLPPSLLQQLGRGAVSWQRDRSRVEK